MITAIKAFFAGWSVYKWIGVVLLVVGFIGGVFLAVTSAYNGVFQRGYDAAVAVEKVRYQDILLQAQDKALRAQIELTKKAEEYGALKAQFDVMLTEGPKEVIRNVRQDPKFAATRRPAALHEQRVRELRQLQTAAAQH